MSTAAWIITFALLLFHRGSAELLEHDCGVASDPINGIRPNPTPWLAIIQSDQHKCSGVLIHQQYVITAASCIINSTQTRVRLGDFHESEQKHFHYEEYYGETAIVHSLFNERNYLNDLALLKLQKEVTYKPHIRPICVLMDRARKASVDSFMEFRSTLWGLNEMRPFPNPRTEIISRLDANKCTAIFKVAPKSSQICASFSNNVNCLELGSPLGKMFNNNGTQRYTLYGIQSYGNSKTCVFTDIMSYVDWIVEHVLEVRLINLKQPQMEVLSD